jgi:hypothetical protein
VIVISMTMSHIGIGVGGNFIKAAEKQVLVENSIPRSWPADGVHRPAGRHPTRGERDDIEGFNQGTAAAGPSPGQANGPEAPDETPDAPQEVDPEPRRRL